MSYVKITEQPSLYNDLEKMSPLEILTCINREDHKVADAVQEVIPAIEKLVVGATERMKQGGRLFYMGSGTSGRVGIVDASEIPPTYGMPHSLVVGIIAGGDGAIRKAVEGAEDDGVQGWKDLEAYNVTEKDTLVGVAASGTTPYVIGAITEARKRGLLTACITSNPGSPITEVAEIPITPVVGPEFVTGSSRMKSGTSQKLICNMITTSIMIGLGRVRGNKMVNMQLTNQKLVDRGTRMLVEELGLPYDEAKSLLLIHGEVQRAIDAYRSAQK